MPGYGVLAFGDSITNGGGELQWGVALQSWALWLARALGLPFTTYAADGAQVADVVGVQIPAFTARAAAPEGPYELGCLYIGVNDARAADWDPLTYEAGLTRAVEFLTARCERTLVPTIPLDLGRPRAGAKVAEANAIIVRTAAHQRALVVDLRDFRGRDLVMADHVHPTAFGQIAIAERALEVVAADGLPAKVRPSELITYETSWRKRLRAEATYAYRHTKVSATAVVKRLNSRVAG